MEAWWQCSKIEGRCADGYFIEPTIIEGLNQQSKTNQEEIFKIVVTIQPFETEEEVSQLANATQLWFGCIHLDARYKQS